MTAAGITTRELNRALLARQGLLEPIDDSVPGILARVGAVQAQSWPAVPVALWTRSARLGPDDFLDAARDGELLLATLLRGTLHVVPASQYPDYAAVTRLTGAADWRRRTKGPAPLVDRLFEELREHTAEQARVPEDVCAFIEAFLERHPDAVTDEEIAFQRQYKWRPFRSTPAFVRTPPDGVWGAKAPEALRAAPPAESDESAALERIVRAHLRAFGPAAPDDVATWIGHRTPPVRDVLAAMDDLVTFGEGKRVLYDLPDAPRPDGGTPAPPKLLPAFDSTLLAYQTGHRERILPDAHKDVVYARSNLQIKPSFLVDGLVAGTWAIEVKRRVATVTLRPSEKLAAKDRKALEDEAERLARFAWPEAKDHAVVVEN
ncbi:winged helix DNA-binding domain-containing protein [Streptomyces sanyensis]|uniref:winged helix DNA-binding domain-containing protein n=1 Tax=Streptomyces sanyensis TaxID=568869 RepID=UPI003D7771C1